MQVIIPSHGNTIKILGKTKTSDSGYRLMTYVLTKHVENGWLLFHVLTREFLLLTDEEYSKLYDLPELYEKWFIVPKDTDDMKCADKVRLIRRTVQKKPEHITNYTIFTTTDCNARCFYCYEMGCSRIPMSEETAHKVADYIEKHCGGEKINITWFGGEPLYNRVVIDIICKELITRGVKYSSYVVSNGYLFDAETVRQATDIWKLKSVQITVDGTEEVYNSTKAYIYKNEKNPYQIVMGNIQRLLDAEIPVSIRINIDEKNAANLMKLAEELHGYFSNCKLLTVYTHVLFKYSGHREKERAGEERRMLYHQQSMLQDKLREYGMFYISPLQKSLPVTRCMADSGNSITILPDGKIGLCLDYVDENFIGHIDDNKFDLNMIKQFHEYRDGQDACIACAIYPECDRLKKCAEQEQCFPETQIDRKEKKLLSMQFTYEGWISKTDLANIYQFEEC